MSADIVDKIMAYEQSDMNQEQTVQFFLELIATGIAFRLQGHYGRTAVRLIEAGLVRTSEDKKRRNRLDDGMDQGDEYADGFQPFDPEGK